MDSLRQEIADIKDMLAERELRDSNRSDMKLFFALKDNAAVLRENDQRGAISDSATLQNIYVKQSQSGGTDHAFNIRKIAERKALLISQEATVMNRAPW